MSKLLVEIWIIIKIKRWKTNKCDIVRRVPKWQKEGILGVVGWGQTSSEMKKRRNIGSGRVG